MIGAITRAAEVVRLQSLYKATDNREHQTDYVRQIIVLGCMSDAEYTTQREAACMAEDRAEHRKEQRDGFGPGPLIRNTYRR